MLKKTYTQINMRQSQLFTKTFKTAPKDEEAVNAKLLTRGGFVRKMSAGIYAYLPLGWRVIQKIADIIREEMNALGGEELLMPTLIAKEYWEKSDRWKSDVIYRTGETTATRTHPAQGEFEYGLGWTHEEVITYLATHFINSYKDLPLAVYQIQNKFRNELRAKNGLLRGREFLMKDLYSFHTDKADLDKYYEQVIGAYKKVFKRLSLDTKITEAAGGAFTKEFTHEFQVLSLAGEDEIFYCAQCDFSQNKEIYNGKAGDKCPKCGDAIKNSKAIEVGNVFKLGTRYSESFDLRVTNKKGKKDLVVMGSYGIGITRAMAALVEVYNDERGIIWPEAVAPFKVHLIAIAGKAKSKIEKAADKVYNQLEKAGVEVLYDDRDVSVGEKLGDADLLGIPYRAVMSEKTLAAGEAGDKIELKKRSEKETKLIAVNELIKFLK